MACKCGCFLTHIKSYAVLFRYLLVDGLTSQIILSSDMITHKCNNLSIIILDYMHVINFFNAINTLIFQLKTMLGVKTCCCLCF